MGEPEPTVVRNWAGNVTYRARRFHEPASLEQVQEIVRGAATIRALGSRHAFNEIADTTGDHVSLASLPRVIDIDPLARTVTVDAGIRYGDLCPVLDAAGFALANLASLPHIAVAGACLTATHGSGDRIGNLSTAVSALDVVRADGELVTIRRSDDPEGLDASVVSLGALGVVTRLTLDVEPAYLMRQDVFDDLPISAFREHVDEITAIADSVSFFTEWREPVFDQVWLKRRVVGTGPGANPLDELFGARRASEERHPIRGVTPEACTAQLGVPGPWYERLPHFRLDHTPSHGEELQAEYFVGREDLVEAIEALEPLRARIAPLILVTEIRTIAPDELWLSPSHRRASATIHFTWTPDWPAVRALLPAIEAALGPFAPRPHWAKLSTMAPEVIRSRYERLPAFVERAEKFDPEGKFRNDYLASRLFG